MNIDINRILKISSRLDASSGYFSPMFHFILMFVFFGLSLLVLQGISMASLEGDEVEVMRGAGDQQNPHIIYLPDRELYFVVWEDWADMADSGANIYGQFFDSNGTPCLSSKVLISRYGGDSGANSSAMGLSGHQTAPRVAYRNAAYVSGGGNDTLLIVWQDTRYDDADGNGTIDSGEKGYIGYIALTLRDGFNSTACDNASKLRFSNDQLVSFVPTFRKDNGFSNSDAKLLSRAVPKVDFDPSRDRFWMAWVESITSRKRVYFRSFYCYSGSNATLNGQCASGRVYGEAWGDVLIPGYVAVSGLNPASAVYGPTIVASDNDTNSTGTLEHAETMKLYSSSRSDTEEVRTYTYFTDVNNVDIKCDKSAPECLLVWEGRRKRLTITSSCEIGTDVGGDNDKTCDDLDDIVTHEWEVDAYDDEDEEDDYVHIYGMFDKNIKLSVVADRISSSLTADQYYPALGIDPSSKRFLVAWEDLRDGVNTKIYGQLYHSGGGAYNQNFIISYQDTDSDGSQDTNVANSRQTRPSIGYDPINQRFFVIWQDSRGGSLSLENLDIYGQFVDVEGSLRGNNYGISTATFNQYIPVVAFSNANSQYMAVWKDARNARTVGNGSDVYGQRFTIGQPQLQILETDYTALSPLLLDMGSILVGERAEHTLILKNTGDTQIEITNIVGPSSPFGKDSSISGLRLQPNGEIALTLSFEPTDTGTFPGNFTIDSDAFKPTVYLQGIGVSAVSPSADTLIFPTTTVNSASSKSLTLTNNSTSPFQIEDISISDSFTYSGISEGDTIDGLGSKIVTVSFNPSSADDVSGSMNITLAGQVSPIIITLTGSGVEEEGIARVHVTPTSIDFGSVQKGSYSLKKLFYINTGQADLRFDNTTWSVDNGNFNITIDDVNLTTGDLKEVTVNATANSTGYHRGRWAGVLTGGDSPITGTNVTLTAIVYGFNGSIEVVYNNATITSMEFPFTQAGSSSRKTFYLVNGANDTSSFNITIDNGNFTLACNSTPKRNTVIDSLDAGDNESFCVTFSPSSEGEYNATISINATSATLRCGLNATCNNVTVSGIAVTSSGSNITVSASELNFGQIDVGSSSSQDVSVTNMENTYVDISASITSGSSLFSVSPSSYSSVLPGATVTFSISYAPTNSSIRDTGTLKFTSDIGNETVSLSGSAIGGDKTYYLSANSKSFSADVGEHDFSYIELTNLTSSNMTVTIGDLPSSPFSVIWPASLKKDSSFTITAGAKKRIQFDFAPSSSGSYSDSLVLYLSGDGLSFVVEEITLSGTVQDQDTTTTAAASLTINGYTDANVTIDFGTISVGDEGVEVVPMENTGDVVLTLLHTTQIKSPFSISSLPSSISTGEEKLLLIKFIPSVSGNYTQSLKMYFDKKVGAEPSRYRRIIKLKGYAWNEQEEEASNTSNTSSCASYSKRTMAYLYSMGKLSISPASIDFGNITVGDYKIKTITIQNKSSSFAVTLDGLRTPISVFKLLTSQKTPLRPSKICIPPSSDVTINVKFIPETGGFFNDDLIFIQGDDELKVSLRGKAAYQKASSSNASSSSSGGAFSISPAKLDFGEVKVNTSSEKELTLSGSDKWIDVRLPDKPFSIEDIKRRFKLSDYSSLKVTFTPYKTGYFADTVDFLPEGSYKPVQVRLTGKGVETVSSEEKETSVWVKDVVNGPDIMVLANGLKRLEVSDGDILNIWRGLTLNEFKEQIADLYTIIITPDEKIFSVTDGGVVEGLVPEKGASPLEDIDFELLFKDIPTVFLSNGTWRVCLGFITQTKELAYECANIEKR